MGMMRKNLWILLVLVTVMGLGAYSWHRFRAWSVNPFVYKPEAGYTYGSVNGVSIKVPNREIFMVDYGHSDGADLPRDEPRTCRSPIQSVTLFLRWPGLVALDGENYDEFQRTKRKSLGYTQWLDIGFRNAGTRPVRLKDGSNYLYAWRQSALDLKPGGERLPPGMAYQYSDDNVIGLVHAVPVGPRSAERASWNQEIYWRANEASRTVMTLIECGGGQYDPPRWVPRCTQFFHIPETQMDVRVTYTRHLLPEWKSIENAVRTHFLSYRATCPAG